MDWLIGYGVKEMISTGTCGVLVPIAENRFLVPVKALRDEGTSYHYVAPSCYIDIDPKMLRPIEKTLSAQGVSLSRGHHLVNRWFLPRNQRKSGLSPGRRVFGC